MTSVSFQAKIQTIQGHARFTNDPEPTVEVNGKKYTAPHILIATGGQPSVLSESEVPGTALQFYLEMVIISVCLRSCLVFIKIAKSCKKYCFFN